MRVICSGVVVNVEARGTGRAYFLLLSPLSVFIMTVVRWTVSVCIVKVEIHI